MTDRDKTKDELMAELELLRGEVATLKQTGRSHPQTHLPQTTPEMANLTILLVDDSEVARATYRRFLMQDRDRTYQIVEFDNGEDALEWCQQNIPDIFLIDYWLPDMDGLELLQQLQQQTGRNTLPVIMFTGQGNIQIAVDLLKSGAQDYLDKSQITPQSLHRSISYVLRNNQLIREREWQQQQQQLLAKTALSIRESIKIEDILNTTVREVRNILQCDRVIIFQFSPGWGGIVVVESVADDSKAILPLQIYDHCIGEEYVEPFKKGLITAKSDIYNSDISPCHIEFLESLQVRANLVVPILKGDELWGLLVAHHCTAPRPWQSSEIELLRQLSAQVSIALQQADLFEQVQTELRERKQAEIAIQKLNVELEQRVIERTGELTEVNDRLLFALLEKERAYQLVKEQAQLLDLAHDSIITWDLNSVITFWNQGAELMYGWKKAEAFGQDSNTLLKTQFPQPLAEIEAELLETGYWEGELIHFTKYDRQITVSSRWVVQKDAAGRPIKILEIDNDISDRKQAEELLQQSESTLRSFFNSGSMMMGIVEIYPHDICHISSNIATSQFFGTTPDGMQNRLASEMGMPQEFIEIWLNYYREAERTGAPVKFEYKHRTAKTPRWLCATTCSIANSSSNQPRFSFVVEEITDRKQAEVTLLQKSRQEHLLWSITQAIRQSLDLNAILNTAVTEVRQTLQTDRAAVYRFNPNWSGDFVIESVREDWVKLVEPGICKIWEDTYLQETQGGRFRNKESFVVNDIYRAGLQTCHLELLEQFQAKSYAVFPIFSGENLWGLLAIYQNATPRNWESWEIELLEQIASQLAIAIQQSELYEELQIELQERQQAAAVLREAERRWRFLLDNVQLVVVGLDKTGAVNYVNPCFLKLTGYTESEALGKQFFETFIPLSERQEITSVLSTILTDNGHPYYQNLIRTKSGEERFIAWNNTILKDSVGNSIGTISIGEDITERQKMEKIKDEFIGIVSHELRTPLTAIQMSLGLLKTGIYDKKPEKSRRMIEIALLDTNRLVHLVNDILDLERIDSGRAVLEKTVCKAADLMQQAIDGIQAIATQQQISLTFTPTDVEVWAAVDAIVQTLTNLLGNALKFSPPQSTIHLSAEIQTDFVLFQVRDRGRGIPADKLELIFARFQQVDASDSREKGGTGLGLSICQSIIERHGGKIWAESILGEGSTFFFTLPLPVNWV
ncbi:MAG: GAF domain-containing protein [Microcoleus sp.]